MKKIFIYVLTVIFVVNIILLYLYFEGVIKGIKSVSLLDLKKIIWFDLAVIIIWFILYFKRNKR